MKVHVADGYQHGKSYRVTLTGAYQYCDTAYKSDDRQPKIKLEWSGPHGVLSETYSVPVTEVGPTLRPSLGLARALTAHGVTWDEVKTGLEFIPIHDRDRAAYDDWTKFPPFSAHKTEGFVPVAVDVVVGGLSLIGSPVIALVELTAEGLAKIETITPVPDEPVAAAPAPAPKRAPSRRAAAEAE